VSVRAVGESGHGLADLLCTTGERGFDEERDEIRKKRNLF
jgi:hypothetical protein